MAFMQLAVQEKLKIGTLLGVVGGMLVHPQDKVSSGLASSGLLQ